MECDISFVGDGSANDGRVLLLAERASQVYHTSKKILGGAIFGVVINPISAHPIFSAGIVRLRYRYYPIGLFHKFWIWNP